MSLHIHLQNVFIHFIKANQTQKYTCFTHVDPCVCSKQVRVYVYVYAYVYMYVCMRVRLLAGVHLYMRHDMCMVAVQCYC